MTLYDYYNKPASTYKIKAGSRIEINDSTLLIARIIVIHQLLYLI
jgi:hypothetical protein